jgi:Holliday junction resolvase
MSHYRAGRDFEHAVRTALVADGYDVIRSAGSKTKVDLAAFKPGQAVFVQCKRDGKISPAERVELLRVASHIDAVPVVAWKQNGKAAIHYWQLTGPGPTERLEWATDITELTGGTR